MPSPATVQDVADRWRPLSDQETINADTFLGDAWRMLKRSLAERNVDVEAQMATDGDLTGEVVRVLATAVLRVMKNPDGLRQEAIDDHSMTRDSDVASGHLYFTTAELDALFPGAQIKGRAFTVDPLADYATRMDS